ncbi:hybrid sensor histidine kinase/response regulator transcription factor [Chitinophaga sp. CB10]|uniref:hybrid sensor histidine kinase/response regulator transcription factor n=1 Tax=Chitinophaga sp. CB10 TaxID=1891659 RepID=UPI0025B89FD0|nr:hybrid sensor histidine kinase/response regulator transcription factor [Chitinophaga sp. CB10]
MRYFFWTVLLLHSIATFAQRSFYNFRKVDIQSGLSHNQVNAIYKDVNGYLWIATMSGLNRYDGYSCKVYRVTPNDTNSLRDNNINAILPLPENKIWLNSNGGSCIYDPATESFNRNSDNYLRLLGLPAGRIRTIVKGTHDRYWFLFDTGELYQYAAGSKNARLFNPERHPQPADRIAAVQEAANGIVWILLADGTLKKYKDNQLLFTSRMLQQERHKPDNFYIDNDGDLWLWSYNTGVLFFNTTDSAIRRIDKHSSPARIKADIVSCVIQDDRGLIWLGTDHGGVTIVDKKDGFRSETLVNIPDDPKSISQNTITTIYKDDKGIIWLGTYKMGVNYYNSGIVQFPYYHRKEGGPGGLPYDDVNRFVEDKQGNLWIGTNGGGLIYFNRQQKTFRQYLHDADKNTGPGSNVIVSLYIDHNNVLWIGTYTGGLSSFDGNKFTTWRHDDKDTTSLYDDSVWEILEDKNHTLWIGMLSGGVDRFDPATGKFEHLANKPGALLSNRVSVMIEDSKGNIWIGTDAGISVNGSDGKVLQTYRTQPGKNSISHDNINCLLEDSNGNIWVGTREGLNLINRKTGKIEVFTLADGLPDNLMLNILEDKQHTLWLTTPNGLCNVIPHYQKDRTTISVIKYDESNNLQGREFNKNAALRTRAGEMVFGGPAGFNIIQPESIVHHNDSVNLTFTGIELLNKPILPGQRMNNRIPLPASISLLKELNLKYNENVFSIEFAALDFASGKYDKYAYRLNGFDQHWIYADESRRRATYTNLDPGHYVFEVKVMNHNGSWSPVKSLVINIAPPFWHTWLAYVLYVLIAVSILLLARQIMLDRVHMRFKMQQQRREAERAHAVDQIKTKFFTNVSHEFRTPLSLIIAPLDRLIKQATSEEQQQQLALVQRNARRLLNLVNQLLDFRKMEVQEIKLYPSVGDIVRFCREISLSFSDIAEKKHINLSFTSDVDLLEIYFDRDKVEKILLNLVSNAFKYTPDNGDVTIELHYQAPETGSGEGSVVLKVRDTGIGIPQDQQDRIFERYFQSEVPESMVNQGTGIGLAITREFVRLHGGTIAVKSEQGKGSCFTVTLPAKKIYEPPAAAATEQLPEELQPREKGNKQKTVLVVEDNEDLRFYLKDNLKGMYHVEEATNGKEGWEKVKQLLPDLVVSDVMMPVMDGVTMAKKIRNEMATAHIPVILLTAMGSEQKQLEALDAGINDYITKPFTYEVLESRIKNLLAHQLYMQKRFQKQIDVSPEEVTITPVDEQFMKQALAIVERNMDNPDFSVEEFSSEMCMSRVTLYRKIMSLTGKAPLDFIRSIRLKRAARLLQSSGLSVSEIAYQVGFNDPKVFRKFFKQEFNDTPSQYAAGFKNTSSPSP